MFRFALVGFSFLASALSATASNSLNMIGDTIYMNGVQDGDCYQLTADTPRQGGGVWSNKMIDVTAPWSFTSQIYLGSKNWRGSNGVAFSLQANSKMELPDSSISVWYASIPNSFACEVDTNWDRGDSNSLDHLQLVSVAGVNEHTAITNEATTGNIEDGEYHTFEITWDPLIDYMTVTLDGEDIIKTTVDGGISQYLNGATEAYFGFTATTDQVYTNEHRVCFNDESVTLIETTTPALPPVTAGGDPHFTMWTGEKYDFHGACDLVLLQNPHFHDGLGMDIHIRTKFTLEWSYIYSAVLQIGHETLEVMGGKKNQYWINKVEGKDLSHGISGFSITFEEVNSKTREFRVDLKDGSVILFKTFNNFIKVDVDGANYVRFTASRGLMGSMEGKKVARDLKTVIDDSEAFGLEWQVLVTEPILFHNIEGVQAPQKCLLPSAASRPKRRRLGQTTLTLNDAELACVLVREQDHDACIFDVLATNTKDIAGAY